jgi:hypothetical protein
MESLASLFIIVFAYLLGTLRAFKIIDLPTLNPAIIITITFSFSVRQSLNPTIIITII